MGSDSQRPLKVVAQELAGHLVYMLATNLRVGGCCWVVGGLVDDLLRRLMLLLLLLLLHHLLWCMPHPYLLPGARATRRLVTRIVHMPTY